MQVYKVRFLGPNGDKTMVFTRRSDLDSAIELEMDEIIDSGSGALSLSLVMKEMTEEEIEALPEFEGCQA